MRNKTYNIIGRVFISLFSFLFSDKCFIKPINIFEISIASYLEIGIIRYPSSFSKN